MLQQTKHFLILGTVCTVLSGCSNDLSDLHKYVENARANRSVKLEPLPTIKPHETYRYVENGRRDPFMPFANASISPSISAKKGKGTGPHPIKDRPKQLLESYPLDSLRMVGILEQKDVRWALIQTNDGTIHRVKKGNYLGQHEGKIMDVTEDKVILMEIVPDGLGGWLERPASLALIESPKGGSN